MGATLTETKEKELRGTSVCRKAYAQGDGKGEGSRSYRPARRSVEGLPNLPGRRSSNERSNRACRERGRGSSPDDLPSSPRVGWSSAQGRPYRKAPKEGFSENLRGSVSSRSTEPPTTPLGVIAWGQRSGRQALGRTRERYLRSKSRRFTSFCNSRDVSHFAAFVIDGGTKVSIVKSCNLVYQNIGVCKLQMFTNQPLGR